MFLFDHQPLYVLSYFGGVAQQLLQVRDGGVVRKLPHESACPDAAIKPVVLLPRVVHGDQKLVNGDLKVGFYHF